MQEIKNSAVLEKLLALAKTEEEPLLTAERVMAAALKMLAEPEQLEQSERAELLPFLAEVHRYGDPKSLSTLLRAHESNENAALKEEERRFRAKLERAREMAQNSSAPELTASRLLILLLREPTDSLGECLQEARKQAVRSASEEKKDAEEDKKKNGGISSLMQQIQQAKANPAWLGKGTETDRAPSEPRTGRESPARETPKREQPAAQTEPPVTEAPKERIAALVEEVRQIRSRLMQTVFGQDKAISVLTNGYFQGELQAMIDRERRKPKASFLFAGPPGVGKTLLAETSAKVMGLPFKRFDMSEYADEMSVGALTGSQKVFVGSEEGLLSGFVSKNPRCILLFDEIEKAHIKAIHLFLQILDAGRLTDGKTREEVSFADTIVIFTTNVGKALYDGSESADLSGVSRKVILSALENEKDPKTDTPYFPAAICSRFSTGNVVMFNHMTAASLRSIARKVIRDQVENLDREAGIRTEVDKNVYTALLLSEGGTADARMISGRAQAFMNEELFELFRLVDSETVPSGIADIESIRFRVQLPENDPAISGLFRTPGDMEVLAFSDGETGEWCRSHTEGCVVLSVQEEREAEALLRERDIRFVLIDGSFGRETEEREFLNVEDVDSRARDFFWRVREKFSDLPIHLLTRPGREYTEEERVSFLRSGVQGFLCMDDDFTGRMREICESMHQQDNVTSLARRSKLVSFETGQRVSADGKEAEICLFDFELSTAVDAEDSGSLLGSASIPDVHFDEVIGAEDAKKELQYFVDYLRNPKRFAGTGVGMPKGVLLYGPPGTGKTMLAKAIACESGVTFLPAEGNQFLKKFVGEGPESVGELFRKARKYAPAVLFIDEIDAIGKSRSGSEQTNANEEVLTRLLTEMDGFHVNPNKPVFVLAATNYNVDPSQGNSLDPALLRRFDRLICVDLPKRDERIRFLRLQFAKKKSFEISEPMLKNIAVRSTGMSPAALASVIELALRMAIRAGSEKVTDKIFEDAFETFSSGDEKKWEASELERTARHEAGHAFLSWLGGDKPSYLTIVARGSHGGYMQHGDNESKGSYTRDELLCRIRTALGGRAAELVYYGAETGLSTGASGDLHTATRLAKAIICSYGMDESFGLAVIDPRAEETPELRAAINRILHQELENALRLIRDNREAMDSLVSELMKNNRLTGGEIDQILSAAVQKDGM